MGHFDFICKRDLRIWGAYKSLQPGRVAVRHTHTHDFVSSCDNYNELDFKTSRLTKVLSP